MSDTADLVKTAFEVFAGQAAVPVEVPQPGLGLVYAIPRGSEQTAPDDYGPWTPADVKQVFYRESSVVGSVLAEIQMVVRWRYSAAQQYIINVGFDSNVISLDPTTDVNIKVEFDTPTQYDGELEAYLIPFHVTVLFDPVGGSSTTVFHGLIRADGTGEFAAE
jgi:hypothetical protein